MYIIIHQVAEPKMQGTLESSQFKVSTSKFLGNIVITCMYVTLHSRRKTPRHLTFLHRGNVYFKRLTGETIGCIHAEKFLARNLRYVYYSGYTGTFGSEFILLIW